MLRSTLHSTRGWQCSIQQANVNSTVYQTWLKTIWRLRIIPYLRSLESKEIFKSTQKCSAITMSSYIRIELQNNTFQFCSISCVWEGLLLYSTTALQYALFYILMKTKWIYHLYLRFHLRISASTNTRLQCLQRLAPFTCKLEYFKLEKCLSWEEQA